MTDCALAERELSDQEFEAYAGTTLSEAEREHLQDLIDWFVRRYPTPAARFAYARRRALAERAIRAHRAKCA